MEIETQELVKKDELPPLNNARYISVRLLNRHERSDSYVDKLLDYEQKNADLNHFDKSLLTELVYGVIRWKGKLDWILTGFYKGDYQKCLNIVKNAMRVGLYQIIFLTKIPIPSAINESVEIVKRIQGEKTAGIVNGVLRNIVRNMENVRYPAREEDAVYYLSVMYSHPKWMIKRWIDRYGEEFTEKMLVSNNHRPNTPLRINNLKAKVEDVLATLEERNIIFYRTYYLEQSIRLRTTQTQIQDSDLFLSGKVTIQDTSSSLAALLASPKPGQTVIDLCSAPGGKAFFLAELMNDEGRVIAMDKYSSKINMIREGADRLGLRSIETLTDDARTFKPLVVPDITFADVPCSGLGTLSRKPDIKWKKEAEDIPTLVTLQREILENAASFTRPGGVIVYSTCTIEPEENMENIEWFLEEYPEFELDRAENYLHKDVCRDGYMQTFPQVHNCSGAFAARLVKKL